MPPARPKIGQFNPSPGEIGGLYTYIRLITESRLGEVYDFSVKSLDRGGGGFRPSLIRNLVGWLRHENPDVVHLHTMNPAVVHMYWALRIVKHPCVLTTLHIHIEDCSNWRPHMRVLMGEVYGSKLLGISKGFYTVCSYGQTRGYMRRHDARNLGVVLNGVQDRPPLSRDEELRASVGLAPDEVGIFMASRAEREKGWHLIPEIARQLESCQRPWRFIVAGDGPDLEKIRSLCAPMDRVRFLGGRKDVAQLNASCDIHLLPTRREFLPFSLIEAMREAKPIVTTFTGGNAELVLDGITGTISPIEDPIHLGSQLRRLVDDPELRSRMGAAGRQRFEQNHTLDQMIEGVAQRYRQVLT